MQCGLGLVPRLLGLIGCGLTLGLMGYWLEVTGLKLEGFDIWNFGMPALK